MSRKSTPPQSSGSIKYFHRTPKLEFEKLKRSIAKDGILVPVVIDQRGDIIDGHHRVRAWNELRAESVKVPNYVRSMLISRAMTKDTNWRSH